MFTRTFIIWATLMGLIFVCSSQATSLLKRDLADPDALVAGGWIYFAGTDGHQETINIYRLSVAQFKAEMAKPAPRIDDKLSLYKTYNPRDSVIDFYGVGHRHRYCQIWAPDLALVEGEVWLTFTAHFAALTDVGCHRIGDLTSARLSPAIFVAKNFGTPLFLNYRAFGVLSHPFNSSRGIHQMRIDSNLYVDVKGTPWLSYTWFDAGNRTASLNIKTGKLISQTNPNYRWDEGITEASSYFYKGGWYYLLYSKNVYNSKYQMYYKKGRAVSDITARTPSCRLTFNSWYNPPTDTHHGYNAGHGTAIEVEGDYYLVYHIGEGSKATFRRHTYVSPLEFYSSGNIQQIPAPAFVSLHDPLVGNLLHCY